MAANLNTQLLLFLVILDVLWRFRKYFSPWGFLLNIMMFLLKRTKVWDCPKEEWYGSRIWLDSKKILKPEFFKFFALEDDGYSDPPGNPPFLYFFLSFFLLLPLSVSMDISLNESIKTPCLTFSLPYSLTP